MNIEKIIADEQNIKQWQVEAVVKLIDEGNTIPFIARYRKEAHGTLNDEQIRNLAERLESLRNLQDKKETVLNSIEEQGLLTDELRAKIEAAMTVTAVDDIYRPYRPKRKTRASVAKERGLEPLANYILEQNAKEDIAVFAKDFVDPEKEVPGTDEAIAGAKDIIAEMISDNADYRTWIRNTTRSEGSVSSTAKDKEASTVYEMYYEYEEPIKKIAGHRVLAINRGEAEKVLTIKVNAPEDKIHTYLFKMVITQNNKFTTPVLESCVLDAYERLIAPSIEREIRNEITEDAENKAIDVFGKNLKQLLMQPPIAGKVVLGWDPAFRTGCKIAVIAPTGKVLDTCVIYPTEPQKKIAEAKKTIHALIDKYKVDIISLGNGTASRESEEVVVDIIKESKRPVSYVIVNEAGASVYSASKLATEEFPNFDVGQRSAASMARRLQDPLAELVKIDPKSIGVGQYQHDMNQKKLSESLGGVVESCVNSVGVDLNTASVPLLCYVSGINKTLANNIVEYRESVGRFKNRNELKKVAKLGPKAFEQCAGFLRIIGGDNPLDESGIHPESYDATKKLLKILDMDVKSAMGSNVSGKVTDTKAMAEQLEIGEITLIDIIKDLEKPRRDPRSEGPKPILRSDVLKLEDLEPGMILKGTVRNVIDFGAFVDIGVHEDGLVHISQICDKFIKHPLDVLSVGDIVEVKVLSVDVKKKRIGLTMKI